MQKSIKIKVDFSGGLDLVFDGKKQLTVQLDGSNKVSHLIEVLALKHANAKKDMFYASQKIKPGILVLINQVDWQVGQRQETELEAGDKVSFISTLHGG